MPLFVVFIALTTARAEPPLAVSGGPGKGITLRTADGKASMNLRTRIVPRFDLQVDPDPEGAEFGTRATINTARLWVSGHIGSERVTYMTQLAYAGRDYRDGTISRSSTRTSMWRCRATRGCGWGSTSFASTDCARFVSGRCR